MLFVSSQAVFSTGILQLNYRDRKKKYWSDYFLHPPKDGITSIIKWYILDVYIEPCSRPHGSAPILFQVVFTLPATLNAWAPCIDGRTVPLPAIPPNLK